MTKKTMKAAIRENYVDFKNIEIKDIPIPQLESDEILVKVHATTVNRTGCALVNGKPFIMRFFIGFLRPKLTVLGTDFAGEVVQVGANVTDYQVGNRVMGFVDEGISGHAEYVAVSIKQPIIEIPHNLDYFEAAACQEATHYAYCWIKNKEINSSHNVLINGATGAIGTALTQFIKYCGASITAVGNTKNIALLAKLGADKIYDYEKQDFLNCDLKYDYIFDAVGKTTFGKSKHLLKSKGVYLSSELGPWIQNPLLAIYTARSKGKKVEFPIPSDIKLSLLYVKKLVESGNYKPVIEKVYSLDEICEAYDYVSSGQKTGNVLLSI